MARPYNRQQMMDALKRAYPNQHMRVGEDFNSDSEGSIWMSAEDGTVDRKGIEIFDYYGPHSLYELGVVKHLNAYVERHGWYFEWYDAGTIFLWEL